MSEHEPLWLVMGYGYTDGETASEWPVRAERDADQAVAWARELANEWQRLSAIGSSLPLDHYSGAEQAVMVAAHSHGEATLIPGPVSLTSGSRVLESTKLAKADPQGLRECLVRYRAGGQMVVENLVGLANREADPLWWNQWSVSVGADCVYSVCPLPWSG